MDVTVTFDVDLEKFRYSLIGDGYLKDEALKMTQEELVTILERRVNDHILIEYLSGKEYGFY